jgi:large subunit ribosomal protein L9
MKVILLKDVRGVGQARVVKEVAGGYAANFLFPQKLAEPATDEKVKAMEAERVAREAEAKKEESELDKKVASLRGKAVSISARATEKGGLFKTVSPKDIVKAVLTEFSLQIPEHSITFPEPVKTVGEHIILLTSKNQKAELGIVVVAAV